MYCRLLAVPSQSVHLSANNIVLKVRQPTRSTTFHSYHSCQTDTTL